MKKTAVAITILLMIFISAPVGLQLINVAKANPISVPTVPSIRVGFPSTSFGDGLVNSSVQFRVYVYLQVDSPDLNCISYSLDGVQQVNLGNLNMDSSDNIGPEKISFKTYTADIILEGLSEGNHTLVAYANGMSDSSNFTVNSYYHVTALNMVSPGNQVYSGSVPLEFTYTGNITNAHYYIYSGHQLISDAALSENITIDSLADGSYDLYVFVTTEFGQDSKSIHFTVFDISWQYPIIIGAIVLIAFSASLLVYFKKLRKH